MSKFLFTIFFYFCAVQYCNGANSIFNWAKQMPFTNFTFENSPNGTIYLVANFTDTIDVDLSANAVYVYPFSSTSKNILILKMDSNANYIWHKVITNGNSDVGSFFLDTFENILITGTFGNTTLDLNPGIGVNNVLNSSSSQNAYLVKLDSSGNYIWGKKVPWFNLSQNIFGLDILSDKLGNVYCNTTSSLSKFDIAGNLIWQKEKIVGKIMCADKHANIYLLDNLPDTLDVAPGSQVVNVNPNNMYNLQGNAVVIKVDSSGNYIWHKQFSGPPSIYNFCIPTNIKMSKSNKIMICGKFEGTADFDPNVGSFPLYATANGPHAGNGFLVLIDTNGIFQWAIKENGHFSRINDAIEDSSGNFYVVGSMRAPTSSGIPNIYKNSFYIAKISPSHNWLWINIYGDTLNQNSAYKIKVDKFQNVYIAGFFQDTIDFNADSNNVFNLTAQLPSSSFIMKVGNCSNFSSTQNYTACDSVFIINQMIYLSDTFYTYHLDTAGCDSASKHQVKIINLIPNIAWTGTKLISGYSGNNVTSISYQWVLCDTSYTPIIGETNSTFTPIQDGEYAVIMTTNNGCTYISNCYTYSTLSMETANSAKNVIACVPNPAKNTLHINSTLEGLYSYSIFNHIGQEVKNQNNVKLNAHSIDVSQCPTGIYYIKFYNSLNTYCVKFVKE